MKNLFTYDDYKEYVNDWISERPKKGRGQLLAMANYLGVHSTMMSHVFKREAELSEEQSCILTEYLGLNSKEADFFILLVQFRRAGSEKLRKILFNRIKEKKTEAKKVKTRLEGHYDLTEEDKSIFYSSWHYSAIRLLANLKGSNTIDALCNELNLPRKKVASILKFLVEKRILKENEGVYKTGTSKTHISNESPHIWKHHQNWRVKAMDRYQQLNDDELFFTAPLTISRKDIPLVKEKSLQFIQDIIKIVEKSGAEEMCCLNIDWVHLY